ncbi:MAG: alpha-amylase family glycosyl hydrolase [Bacilli bacterium]|nr:alpha-amylase family glycosyl hydrolase [Bacilli bacterium]
MLKGNEIIYQIFVRNYSKEGTFAEIIKDLSRLKDLGIDIIYLLPIHEIGVMERKGTYGSPYAIKDYFSISKDLGDLILFKELIKQVHNNGMKIIMDMVFNHTSPDNVIIDTHPEYYFYKNGKRSNRVGDWTDIIDLDNFNPDTQKYLMSVLEYWTNLGIDGYRFDVASVIPLSFFKSVRERFGESLILIGENIDQGFMEYLDSVNVPYCTDDELYKYFDALYNYNWMGEYILYLRGKISYDDFLKSINTSKGLRVLCMENHDNDRIANIIKDEDKLIEEYKFINNRKGLMFLYMGQEYGIKHKPDLFSKDPVIWKRNDKIYEFIKLLIKDKKSLKY